MRHEFKKEMLKTIEVTRESAKNTLELSLDNYAEIISKLDFITYLLLNEEKNSFKV